MCGVSTSLRFPGQLNGFVRLCQPSVTDPHFPFSDLRKLGMNLIPFPRVRTYMSYISFFLTTSLASLPNAQLCAHIQQCFSIVPRHLYSWTDKSVRIIFSSSLLLRKPLLASTGCSIARIYWLLVILVLGMFLTNLPSIHIDNVNSRYLTAATIFRGNVSSREAEASLFRRIEKSLYEHRALGCGPWPSNTEFSTLCWVSR